MKFKVAIVQFHVYMDDVEKTFQKIESYVKKASGKAEIIVFPEYIISWNFVDKKDSFRKRFQDLARKYKIDIVTGSMLAKYKSKLYDLRVKQASLGHEKRPV